MQFGVWSAALAGLIAIIMLVWAFVAMPEGLEGRSYYELLFWAAGHILQFTHTALMLVCWLWLASICGAKIPGGPRLVMGAVYDWCTLCIDFTMAISDPRIK